MSRRVSPRTPDFFSRLVALDARWVAAGFPAISPWWRDVLRAFFRSTRRRFVARVGRRGGKSSTLARVAVAVALVGDWSVPAGDVGVIPFLSVDKVEAASRLRTIAALLDALKIEYARRTEEIELRDRPVIFRAMAASARTAVGFTSPLVICDEVARWRDSDTGANPAKEVLAAVSPTTATTGGRILVVSSAFSVSDFHAELIDRGEDEYQAAHVAPTWATNPTLTEADTRALEPDPRTWSREYQAVPVDSVSSIADRAEIDACVRSSPISPPPSGAPMLLDAGLRVDATALIRAWRITRERPDGAVEDVLVTDVAAHLAPTFLHRVTLDEIVSAIVAAHRACPGIVFADQHYFDAIEPRVRERGIAMRQLGVTAPETTARIEQLQARIASRTISLPDHDVLLRELREAQLVAHGGGRLTLRAPDRRGAHDDLVSALLLAHDAEIGRRLPFGDGEIVTIVEPIGWQRDTHTLTGGERRYYRRTETGALVPREPPEGTEAFAEWAEEMIASGHSTPSIARWQERRRAEDAEARGVRVNVPITDF